MDLIVYKYLLLSRPFLKLNELIDFHLKIHDEARACAVFYLWKKKIAIQIGTHESSLIAGMIHLQFPFFQEIKNLC